MKILVTGAAGFIGFHLINSLAMQGADVVGIDNINDYYDVNLKYGRLAAAGINREDVDYGQMIQSTLFDQYRFMKLDLTDNEHLTSLFEIEQFDIVCNLAAQAGVRYSITNPRAYTESNITGFLNILEACRAFSIKHLVYASSSSVYGLNEEMPFSERHSTNHPVSLYAASKKSNELMAHTYSHLFNLPTTGLRFFTVYGPWGRPDMAMYSFTKAILEERQIDIYNNGEMRRDFTYIDDIVDGIMRVLTQPALPDQSWKGTEPCASSSSAPYRVYNIGRGEPANLIDFIEQIELNTNKEAIRNLMPLQDGDVLQTWADVESLKDELGYNPTFSMPEGVKRFVGWYIEYYGVKENPKELAEVV